MTDMTVEQYQAWQAQKAMERPQAEPTNHCTTYAIPEPPPESPFLGTWLGIPVYWGPAPDTHSAVADARQAYDEAETEKRRDDVAYDDGPVADDGAGLP